jgi:hypothetical protein
MSVRSKYPELDGLSKRRYRQQFRRLASARRLAAGLRYDGRPRVRGTKHRYRDLDGLPPRARAVARVQRWTERERYDKGLTQRGTPRRTKQSRLPITEQRYREFRASLNIQRPELLPGLER